MARLNRERFPDPNVPPPGTTAVTYGDGLLVSEGSVVEVDFGTDHDQVARGDAAGGSSSPTTVRGDLIRRGASADERLAIGGAGRILRSDGTDPAWSTVVAALEAVGSTRGQILRRASGAWEALGLGTSGHVLTSDGSDAAWAAPTTTRAAILAALTTNPASGTWVETETGGAVIAAGPTNVVATVPASVSSCAAYAVVDWSAADVYDLRFRLTVDGSTTSSLITYLVVTYGAGWLFFRCRGDGHVQLKHGLGGDIALATVTGRPVDGTGELRLAVRGTRVTAWHGTVGSTPEWILFHDADVAGLVTEAVGRVLAPTSLRVQAATEGGTLAGETDVTWDITVTSGIT